MNRFIQWFPVLLAEPSILGLEILLLVMLRLVANVFLYSRTASTCIGLTLNSP